LASAAVLFAARTASAQGSSSLALDLTWNAPPECESRESVLAAVERVAGGPREKATPLRARVTVTSFDAGAWHAVLEIETPRGASERAFDAESCSAVVSAVAIMMAVAADGENPATPNQGTPREEPARVAPRAPEGPTHEARERRVTAGEPPRGARSQLEAMLGASIDGRSLPSFSGGGEIGAGWTERTGSWRLRAIASAAFDVPRSSAAATGEGAKFWWAGASGRLCAAPVWGRIDVGPCFDAEVDGMWTSGARGPAPSFHAQAGDAVWWSVGGSLLASIAVSDAVGVFARGDALVPLVRPSFVVERAPSPAVQVYEAHPWNARGAVGVELRFF